MGQKINPIGFRLGINRGWDSTWFAKKKDFGRYLIEDFKMKTLTLIMYFSLHVRTYVTLTFLHFQFVLNK